MDVFQVLPWTSLMSQSSHKGDAYYLHWQTRTLKLREVRPPAQGHTVMELELGFEPRLSYLTLELSIPSWKGALWWTHLWTAGTSPQPLMVTLDSGA
jgi:hypothetical protein